MYQNIPHNILHMASAGNFSQGLGETGSSCNALWYEKTCSRSREINLHQYESNSVVPM